MVPRKCYKIQAISGSWRPTAFVASSVVPGAAETVGVSHYLGYHQDRIWMPEPNKSAVERSRSFFREQLPRNISSQMLKHLSPSFHLLDTILQSWDIHSVFLVCSRLPETHQCII